MPNVPLDLCPGAPAHPPSVQTRGRRDERGRGSGAAARSAQRTSTAARGTTIGRRRLASRSSRVMPFAAAFASPPR
jgi:hypothetical protein